MSPQGFSGCGDLTCLKPEGVFTHQRAAKELNLYFTLKLRSQKCYPVLPDRCPSCWLRRWWTVGFRRFPVREKIIERTFVSLSGVEKWLPKLSSWHVWQSEVTTLKLYAGWTRLWGRSRPYRGAAVAGPPALTLYSLKVSDNVLSAEKPCHTIPALSWPTDSLSIFNVSEEDFRALLCLRPFPLTHKARARLCGIVSWLSWQQRISICEAH